MDKTLAWLWLADAVGSGCQYAQELLTLYPDPAELYDALRAGTEAPPACLTPHALAQLRDTTPFDYEERLDHCLLSGIDVLTPDEGVYPDRLRDLPDLPLALYVTGDIACLNGRRYAGMVGTRRPSTYGRQAAFDLSLAMARAGVVLVSGLADGLDSEAHRAAVQADVPTVAFLGTAIDKTYPASNAKLRTAIEKGGGAVCSEYPPGYSGRTTGTFLARNRLIAAQSEALCVAEARTRSGTLNTVGHAERLGRPVLAVPGSIYSALSEGTNELLRTHRAEPLCKAADALDILGIGAETAPRRSNGLTPHGQRRCAGRLRRVKAHAPKHRRPVRRRKPARRTGAGGVYRAGADGRSPGAAGEKIYCSIIDEGSGKVPGRIWNPPLRL